MMLGEEHIKKLKQWFNFDQYHTMYNTHDKAYSSTGDVRLIDKDVTKLPVAWHTIKNFYCNGFFEHGGSLTTLEGSPVLVTHWFECDDHKLTSLDYFPGFIGGTASCRDNLIRNFKTKEYRTYIVKSTFDMRGNPIESFDGLENFNFEYMRVTRTPDLPLLSLFSYANKDVGVYGPPGTAGQDVASQIFFKHIHEYQEGKVNLRKAIILCQSELIKNGFASNAKL